MKQKRLMKILNGNKQTGWFGVPGVKGTGTRVHAIINGQPLCRCRLGALQEFQFCASHWYMPYIDCGNCKHIIGRINEKS